MPIAAFDAPGPRVTKAMPGTAGQLAVGFGHVGDAAFLPADDEPQAVADVVERVEHREVAFAGDAERERGALRNQVGDEDLAAGSFAGQGYLRNAATPPPRIAAGRAAPIL